MPAEVPKALGWSRSGHHAVWGRRFRECSLRPLLQPHRHTFWLHCLVNDDQQLSATGGGANVNRLLNAKRVNGNGIETDFEILITDNFLLIANASYNDTEIDDPDLLRYVHEQQWNRLTGRESMWK